MHAIVIHADVADMAEAKRGLSEEIIPYLRGLPGFVGAHFVAIDDAHALSIEVFETEEEARSVAPPEGTKVPGVTLAKIQLCEVIGAA